MQANETSQVTPDSQQCRDYALFFRHLPGWCTSLSFPIFFILSIVLIVWLNNETEPPENPVIPPAPVVPEETAVSPATDADLPPPYQPPSTNDETTDNPPSTVEEAVKIPKKRNSAEAFVNGSAILACLIPSLVFTALPLQAAKFCFGPEVVPRWLLICCWVSYALLILYATSAAACWLVLFRNLWGPRIIKKYPIDQTFAPFLIGGILFSPLIVLYLLLRQVAKGCAYLIEGCQRRFCGDALEDEVEDIREDVELEAGRVSLGADENEEDEESRYAQESQGLMKAFGNV